MDTTQQPTTAVLHHPSSKKKIMWIAIAGVIILAIITAIVAVNMSKNTSALSTNATVDISKSGINPATIRLEAGQGITLNNNDEVSHALTADQDALPGFETPEPLNTGDSYSYIFEKKGTYRIYDPEAPQALNATIIVE